MPRKKYYKSKKIIETYDYLPPPRSRVYANSTIIKEEPVKVGGNKYLMRTLSCGGIELVRYDHTANKWAVLCFSGIETQAEAA